MYLTTYTHVDEGRSKFDDYQLDSIDFLERFNFANIDKQYFIIHIDSQGLPKGGFTKLNVEAPRRCSNNNQPIHKVSKDV